MEDVWILQTLDHVQDIRDIPPGTSGHFYLTTCDSVETAIIWIDRTYGQTVVDRVDLNVGNYQSFLVALEAVDKEGTHFKYMVTRTEILTLALLKKWDTELLDDDSV